MLGKKKQTKPLYVCVKWTDVLGLGLASLFCEKGQRVNILDFVDLKSLFSLLVTLPLQVEGAAADNMEQRGEAVF